MPPNPHHHRHDHHHHHHDYHPCHQASINSPCCCSGCHSCNSPASPPPPPPPAISIDQLLQYMAADFIKIQPFVKSQQIHSQTTLHIQSLLHDLIRRVSAVESSLSQLSSQSPPNNKSPPPFSSRRPQDTPPPSPLPVPSLRDVAARTIQARFRRFLVRRSQTLRDLQRLASVKSRAASLRSLISGNSGAEPDALLQKAMDLLLQLDSIQSSDPMIRDGKRSISRELTSMLDFVEKVLVRERQLSLQTMEAQEDTPLPLPHARSAKRVSFAEHGGRTEEAKEGFSRVLEEEVFGYGNGTNFPGQDVGFGLSAPLPLQMEPRLGL